MERNEDYIQIGNTGIHAPHFKDMTKEEFCKHYHGHNFDLEKAWDQVQARLKQSTDVRKPNTKSRGNRDSE